MSYRGAIRRAHTVRELDAAVGAAQRAGLSLAAINKALVANRIIGGVAQQVRQYGKPEAAAAQLCGDCGALLGEEPHAVDCTALPGHTTHPRQRLSQFPPEAMPGSRGVLLNVRVTDINGNKASAMVLHVSKGRLVRNGQRGFTHDWTLRTGPQALQSYSKGTLSYKQYRALEAGQEIILRPRKTRNTAWLKVRRAPSM